MEVYSPAFCRAALEAARRDPKRFLRDVETRTNMDVEVVKRSMRRWGIDFTQ